MPARMKELTTAEIAERAAEIRAGWTDSEYYKRAGIPEARWTPPLMSAMDVPEDWAASSFSADVV